jgi:hypothetical protein
MILMLEPLPAPSVLLCGLASLEAAGLITDGFF